MNQTAARLNAVHYILIESFKILHLMVPSIATLVKLLKGGPIFEAFIVLPKLGRKGGVLAPFIVVRLDTIHKDRAHIGGNRGQTGGYVLGQRLDGLLVASR